MPGLRDTFGISEICYRYERRLSNEKAGIADWLLRLTVQNKHWSLGLCFLYLRNLQDSGWNYKRVCRIYRDLVPHLRVKPCRRLKRARQDKLAVPERPSQVLSLDSATDQMIDGRMMRVFCLIDGHPANVFAWRLIFPAEASCSVRVGLAG